MRFSGSLVLTALLVPLLAFSAPLNETLLDARDGASFNYITGFKTFSTGYPSLSKVSLADAVHASVGTTGTGTVTKKTPDGSLALAVTYKAGSAGSYSGITYYTTWDSSIKNAKEIVLSYKVYFANGFNWVKGGKMIGVYGGSSNIYGCSGGDQADRDSCNSLRLMWRTNGAMEIYSYLPETSGNQASCKASGASADCSNPSYGLSFGRGNGYWVTGRWQTVQQHYRLNDVGSKNGFIKLIVDGNEIVNGQHLEIVKNKGAGFKGMFVSSFFGGHDFSWAPSSDQHAYYKDFSVGVISY